MREVMWTPLRRGGPRRRVRGDREVECGFLGEDCVFHPGHVVPRLDPQFGHQEGAQILEDPERFGLASRTVERQHALRPQSLAQRVGTGQRLQLAREGLVAAQGQTGVDPRFGGRQPELLQAAGLGPGERYVPHLAVGRAPPQALGLGEQPDALARAPAGQWRRPSFTRRSSRRASVTSAGTSST